MPYCPRCRMGTFDSQGLCILCGAPAAKATGLRRAWEWLGDALSLLLGPAGLALLGAALLLVLFLTLPHVGGSRPPAMRGLSPLNPTHFLADARAHPLKAIVALLLPAVVELVVVLAIASLAYFVFRRARGGAPPDRREAPTTRQAAQTS